jgi:hypothetical protein
MKYFSISHTRFELFTLGEKCDKNFRNAVPGKLFIPSTLCVRGTTIRNRQTSLSGCHINRPFYSRMACSRDRQIERQIARIGGPPLTADPGRCWLITTKRCKVKISGRPASAAKASTTTPNYCSPLRWPNPLVPTAAAVYSRILNP